MTEPTHPALPDGYGQDDAGGCACRQTTPAPAAPALLALGLLALGRRRRAIAPSSPT